MTLNFVEEKRASRESAVLAFFSGTLGTCLLIMGFVSTASLSFNLDLFFAGGFVSYLGTALIFVSGFLQLSVLRQWTNCITANISNTWIIMDILKHRTPEKDEAVKLFSRKLTEMRLDYWPVVVYVLAYVVAQLSSVFGIVFMTLGLIALSVYLVKLFRITSSLEDMKTKIYSYLLEKIYPDEMYTIPKRNVTGIFILSLITLGIYWYYLLLKLTTEINVFIEVDSNLRFRIKEKYLKQS